jgi:hypothetical protein
MIPIMKLYPELFEYIDEPTDEVVDAFLSDPDNIQYVSGLSESFRERAVRRAPASIQHIPNPPKDLQFVAVRANPSLVLKIQNPHPEVVDLALILHPRVIVGLRDPTPDQQRAAFRTDYMLMEEMGYDRVDPDVFDEVHPYSPTNSNYV